MTNECPVLWMDEYVQVIRAQQFLQKGILPHSGGWAEQPWALMQMIEAFNSGAGLG